jgi:hypothetical protein
LVVVVGCRPLLDFLVVNAVVWVVVVGGRPLLDAGLQKQRCW